jgi:hypothetical protein
MMDYLTGKDYKGLCNVCKSAIDTAHMIIVELGPDDQYANDPEGPSMFAYDHGWFCGGHEALCNVDTEEDEDPKLDWVAWIWDGINKNGAYHDRYRRVAEFKATHTDALWLFRQVAEELGFKFVRRDRTTMGGHYTNEKGDSLVVLEEYERPDTHLEYGSFRKGNSMIVRGAPMPRLACLEGYDG